MKSLVASVVVFVMFMVGCTTPPVASEQETPGKKWHRGDVFSLVISDSDYQTRMTVCVESVEDNFVRFTGHKVMQADGVSQEIKVSGECEAKVISNNQLDAKQAAILGIERHTEVAAKSTQPR